MENTEPKNYCVDLKNVKTKRQLHNRLKKYLELPSYYGRNLDALNDILTSWQEPCKITFVNWQGAKASLADYFASLMELLHDASSSELSVSWE